MTRNTCKGTDLVIALLRNCFMLKSLAKGLKGVKGLSIQNNGQIYSKNKFNPLESMVYK